MNDMIRYNVRVNEHTYQVDLLKDTAEQQCTEFQESSADICFDAIKTEYDYCVTRAEKLENKVYILLAACAFLFVLLTTLIEKVEKIEYPQNILDLCAIILYITLLIIAVISNVGMIIMAVNLLKSISFERFDAGILLTNGIPDEKDTTAVKFIGSFYIKNINENNSLLEKRYIAYNKCVELFCASTVLLIVLAVISIYLCK